MASSPFASAPSAEDAVDRVKGLRVGRNVLFLMAGQVVYCLINVAAMSLLGRALAPQGYGQYAFYYALIPLFASVSDAGIGMIVTREVARDRTLGPRLLGDSLIIKGAISGTLLLGVLAVAWTMLAPPAAMLISIVAATALIDPTQDPSIWMFRAREQLHLEALLMVLSQVVWLPLLFLGVATKAGLSEFLGAAMFAFIVRLVIGAVIVVRRFGRPEFRPERARLMRLVAEGLPFGAAIFGTVLYNRVGLLAVNALSTSSDVAYLNVATMLSQPFSFIANVIGIAILPMVARNARTGDHLLRRDLLANFKWQVLAALPLTVGLSLVARPIVALLFKGRDFAPAAVGLQVMSLGLVVLFLNLSSRYVLTALDRQGHYLRAIVAGLVANVVLCLVLIPSMGFLGACVAFLGAELTISIVCQHALGGRLRFHDMAAVATKPLVAALGMGLLVFALRGMNIFPLAALGCASYIGFLFLLRAFSDEELQTLRNVGVSFGARSIAPLQRVGDRP
jgi:O-antigen/teichoic acid export membrane protein